MNATNGANGAQYEFDAFGNPLRATGALAFVNPFNFSTKFCDWETGFYYYGYRYYDPSTGRWLSRDPIAEKGGINLYGFIASDSLNFFDYLGESKGHHIFPQAVSEGMSKAVRDFFDKDVNRIFNEFYKKHGAQKMADISAKEYNKIITAELEKFLGRAEIKNVTLAEAEKFMLHVESLPAKHSITIYNKAVEREAYQAMKQALAKQAERAAESSLLKAEAGGAKKIGGKKIGKLIPVVGTVVAIYFIHEDAAAYGSGPAVANGIVDAIPLVGTGKVGSEIVAGGRWLDVFVGPKEVQPTAVCDDKK